jgi:hypothetical protein
MEIKLNSRWENVWSGERVTLLEITSEIVTYRKDNPNAIIVPYKLMAKFQKPLSVFIKQYKPLI